MKKTYSIGDRVRIVGTALEALIVSRRWEALGEPAGPHVCLYGLQLTNAKHPNPKARARCDAQAQDLEPLA